MNSGEQQLIDFALTWQPFGGPPSEEVLTIFGISVPMFRHRVRRILITQGPVGTEPFRRHARSALASYLTLRERAQPRPPRTRVGWAG
ncbi:hypothetical protein ACFXG4_19630 [Nocardia sp. NPDC059246]|uniref:hypothetical protein n=1 Tax=unclassified Nocardia TaxID=2637762 RepID=UPI0036766D19